MSYHPACEWPAPCDCADCDWAAYQQGLDDGDDTPTDEDYWTSEPIRNEAVAEWFHQHKP